MNPRMLGFTVPKNAPLRFETETARVAAQRSNTIGEYRHSEIWSRQCFNPLNDLKVGHVDTSSLLKITRFLKKQRIQLIKISNDFMSSGQK